MPVTFVVANHDAKPIPVYRHLSFEGFLKTCCAGEILQSSITEPSPNVMLWSQKNGFVGTVVKAYGEHHHLRIRPDDVWIAILSQLSFYVNKHAEDLRDYFVAHEGKKTLCVGAVGTRYSVDFGRMAIQMSSQIHKHVVDKTLVEWVLPDFTTSTPQDTTICSVLLMSTLQKYFRYVFSITCGIPSVTLEGEKADWERLYKRLDRLPELGTEPEQWAAMLRPILRRFVEAFDGNPDVNFWEHVVHTVGGGCFPATLSGWITAFCVWDVDGKWLAGARTTEMTETMGSVMIGNRRNRNPEYTLDGVSYFTLDLDNIPAGYSKVDVLVDDNGERFECEMVSGHLACAASKTVEDGPFDTLSPAPQWFLYVKADEPHRG